MLTSRDLDLIEERLTKRFATKDDLKSMEGRQDKKFATKDDLKHLVSKTDVKSFATKGDLQELAKQKDLLEVKSILIDLRKFSLSAFGNLFEWVDDIHKATVKIDLPKRLHKSEKSSSIS